MHRAVGPIAHPLNASGVKTGHVHFEFLEVLLPGARNVGWNADVVIPPAEIPFGV